MLFLFFVFLLGLMVGSFLNAVIFRLYSNESISYKSSFERSHCPICKHELAWYDLIPVFSFIMLKAKCRYCGKPISWQYPLVEIATGFTFVFIFQHFVGFFDLFYYLTLSCLLLVVFVYDLKHYIIPDKVTIALIFFVLYHFLYMLTSGQEIVQGLANHFLSAVGSFCFLGAIFLISKGRSMGFGDVKLAFFMGLSLGFPGILAAFFISFVLGGMVGCVLMLFHKKGLKSEIPFGPFLAFGTFAALFFGKELIEWYLSFAS